MIRPANISDLSRIKQLTEACAQALIEKGIFQWNEHYPSLEKIQRDIENQEMYLLERHQEILGIIVLSSEMDPEYSEVHWITENQHNLYIHRLATRPDHWGAGIARTLMDYAEEYARRFNYRSIRLDTFSKNLRNQKFYGARGYIRLGEIFFPMQSEHPFFCYEKILD